MEFPNSPSNAPQEAMLPHGHGQVTKITKRIDAIPGLPGSKTSHVLIRTIPKERRAASISAADR